jgi:hypothetical protein
MEQPSTHSDSPSLQIEISETVAQPPQLSVVFVVFHQISVMAGVAQQKPGGAVGLGVGRGDGAGVGD